MIDRIKAAFGILVFIGIAFLFSKNRRRINWFDIAKAFGLQFLMGLLFTKTRWGIAIFEKMAAGFARLYEFADSGSQFVFGKLADTNSFGVIFAIKVLPIIIFFGALTSLLFHLGVIQLLVKGMAYVIQPVIGASGAETLCAAANSMLGQTEAPLLVRKYLEGMTESEVMSVMISGMATISGSLMAVYGAMGVPARHMIAGSLMSIPGSLMIAKILIPETETPKTAGGAEIEMESDSKNIIDAISTGTSNGMYLAANVLAMLISFLGLIALLNSLLGKFGSLVGIQDLSLNWIFGKSFAFLGDLLGLPAADRAAAGSLLGQKVVINEFVAYANMMKTTLAEKSRIVLTYALCGFSNFSCIGIQVGGIGAIAPSIRLTLTRLGLRAVLGAMIVNLINASIISAIL